MSPGILAGYECKQRHPVLLTSTSLNCCASMKKLFLLALVIVGCNNAASVEQPHEYMGDCAAHTGKYLLTDTNSVWRYDTLSAYDFIHMDRVSTNHALRDSAETTVYTFRGRVTSVTGDMGNPSGNLGMLRISVADSTGGVFAYIPIASCNETHGAPYFAKYKAINDSIRTWYGWPEEGRSIEVSDSVEIVGVGVSAPSVSSFTWRITPVLSIKRF